MKTDRTYVAGRVRGGNTHYFDAYLFEKEPWYWLGAWCTHGIGNYRRRDVTAVSDDATCGMCQKELERRSLIPLRVMPKARP